MLLSHSAPTAAVPYALVGTASIYGANRVALGAPSSGVPSSWQQPSGSSLSPLSAQMASHPAPGGVVESPRGVGKRGGFASRSRPNPVELSGAAAREVRSYLAYFDTVVKVGAPAGRAAAAAHNSHPHSARGFAEAAPAKGQYGPSSARPYTHREAAPTTTSQKSLQPLGRLARREKRAQAKRADWNDPTAHYRSASLSHLHEEKHADAAFGFSLPSPRSGGLFPAIHTTATPRHPSPPRRAAPPPATMQPSMPSSTLSTPASRKAARSHFASPLSAQMPLGPIPASDLAHTKALLSSKLAPPADSQAAVDSFFRQYELDPREAAVSTATVAPTVQSAPKAESAPIPPAAPATQIIEPKHAPIESAPTSEIVLVEPSPVEAPTPALVPSPPTPASSALTHDVTPAIPSSTLTLHAIDTPTGSAAPSPARALEAAEPKKAARSPASSSGPTSPPRKSSVAMLSPSSAQANASDAAAASGALASSTSPSNASATSPSAVAVTAAATGSNGSSSSSTAANSSAVAAYKAAKAEARARAAEEKEREEAERKRKANEDLARRMRIEAERNESRRLAEAEAARMAALETRNRAAKQAELLEKRRQELYDYHVARTAGGPSATATGEAEPVASVAGTPAEVMSAVDPLVRACVKGDIGGFTRLLAGTWSQLLREERTREEAEVREAARVEKERKEKLAKEIQAVLEAAAKRARAEQNGDEGDEEDDENGTNSAAAANETTAVIQPTPPLAPQPPTHARVPSARHSRRHSVSSMRSGATSPHDSDNEASGNEGDSGSDTESGPGRKRRPSRLDPSQSGLPPLPAHRRNGSSVPSKKGVDLVDSRRARRASLTSGSRSLSQDLAAPTLLTPTSTSKANNATDSTPAGPTLPITPRNPGAKNHHHHKEKKPQLDPQQQLQEATEVVRRVNATNTAATATTTTATNTTNSSSTTDPSPPVDGSTAAVTVVPAAPAAAPSTAGYESEAVRRMAVYLDRRDADGKSILMHAIWRKQSSLVPLLLALGSSPNAQDSFQSTALHLACTRGLEPVIVELVSRGARIDVTSNKGRLAYEQPPSVELKEIVRIASALQRATHAQLLRTGPDGERVGFYSEADLEPLEAYVARKTLQLMEAENERKRTEAAAAAVAAAALQQRALEEEAAAAKTTARQRAAARMGSSDATVPGTALAPRPSVIAAAPGKRQPVPPAERSAAQGARRHRETQAPNARKARTEPTDQPRHVSIEMTSNADGVVTVLIVAALSGPTPVLDDAGSTETSEPIEPIEPIDSDTDSNSQFVSVHITANANGDVSLSIVATPVSTTLESSATAPADVPSPRFEAPPSVAATQPEPTSEPAMSSQDDASEESAPPAAIDVDLTSASIVSVRILTSDDAAVAVDIVAATPSASRTDLLTPLTRETEAVASASANSASLPQAPSVEPSVSSDSSPSTEPTASNSFAPTPTSGPSRRMSVKVNRASISRTIPTVEVESDAAVVDVTAPVDASQVAPEAFTSSGIDTPAETDATATHDTSAVTSPPTTATPPPADESAPPTSSEQDTTMPLDALFF